MRYLNGLMEQSCSEWSKLRTEISMILQDNKNYDFLFENTKKVVFPLTEVKCVMPVHIGD